jgi:Na+-transporting methylmalonyl-CoA/oxaloacetate decarboxylase gamma subunit
MGVVFLVLIVLSLVIYGLGKLDQRTGVAVASQPMSSTTPVSAAPVSDISPQVVAAIGVALAMAQGEAGIAGSTAVSSSAQRVGGTMPAGWVSSGLARQMATRARGSIRRNR